MHETEEQSDTWTALMRRGAFEKAWELSDDVLKSGLHRNYLSLPRNYQCIWNGASLMNKRVFIRCYHGLGDTIMFIRYTPLVKRIASEVIVWAQPKLVDLLKTADGIDEILPLHDGTPETSYDVDVEIMELAHVFRTTILTIPLNVPYLHVDPLSPGNGSKLAVGFVWKTGEWDLSRNIPFELVKALFEIKGIIIYILQDNAEGAGWIKGYGIHPGKCSLFDHARIIAGLDLMITVDSMPAHLAGALNVPTWLLLKHDADWRWMENRSDSPWYPSMKLFRQRQKGDWKSVIDEVSGELTALSESFIHSGK